MNRFCEAFVKDMLCRDKAMRMTRIGLVLLWPFIWYWRCLIPGHPFSLGIANDFVHLYYLYKVYLLDVLSTGSFPLWSPCEAAGYPFWSSPFTQAVYPANLVLLLWHKAFQGYSIFDHQLYAVAGIAIYGLGLYLWLQRLTSSHRATLFAALVVTASFKLGEILRFPNAVHTAAWMPWLLYGITCASQDRRVLRSFITILVSSVMLLTGGYPYYTYYTLFLVPPYFLLISCSGTRGVLISNGPSRERFTPKRYWSIVLSASGAAVLLCLPYLLKTFQLLIQTADRTGGSYLFSTQPAFTPTHTLGSLVFPPASQAEGWFYIGMLPLYLIVFFTALTVLQWRTRRLQLRFIGLLILWIGVIEAITYGQHSYLFDLLWRWMPGFSSLRMWGRMNIILLPLLGLMLARAWAAFEDFFSGECPDESRRVSQTLLIVLTAFAGVCIGVQMLLWRSSFYDMYWMLFFTQNHGMEWRFVAAGVAGFLVLAGTLIASISRSARHPLWPALLLVVFLCCYAWDVHPVGSTQWTSPVPANYGRDRGIWKIRDAVQESFYKPRIRYYSTITLPNSNTGWILYWYYKRYMDFERRFLGEVGGVIGPKGIVRYGVPIGVGKLASGQEVDAYLQFMGMKNGRRIFLSRRVDHKSLHAFVEDARGTEDRGRNTYEVEYYDGDRLGLRVKAGEPLFVNFIDNWDPDWHGWIDGEEVKLERLFGTFKTVRITPGLRRVEFKYRPF